jgi:hypothetical protein
MKYSVGELVFVKDFIGDDDSNQIGLIIQVNTRIPYFTTYKVLFEDCVIEVSEIFLDRVEDI